MPPRYNYRCNLATIIPCGRGVDYQLVPPRYNYRSRGRGVVIIPPWTACSLQIIAPSYSLVPRRYSLPIIVAALISANYWSVPTIGRILIPARRILLIGACHLALLLIAINQCQAGHCPSSLPLSHSTITIIHLWINWCHTLIVKLPILPIHQLSVRLAAHWKSLPLSTINCPCPGWSLVIVIPTHP